ncbi:unnamed protein product, partial [Timema podura]|nr:unnamed protein product [Timema podura]
MILFQGIKEVSSAWRDVRRNRNHSVSAGQIAGLNRREERTLRVVREEKILDESSPLLETIRKVRKEIWSYYDVYKGYRQRVTDFVETGIAHTESTRHFLQEEENLLPRVGAITLGVLTGFVLGLRGGRFKRLTYSTLGGLTMASICYPREANEVTQEAIVQAKKYFTIGYNFAYG